MGEVGAFLKYNRELPKKSAVQDRITHFNEFIEPHSKEDVKKQTDRCMDCGVPFCHSGCPLGNRIPEFNDAISKGEWKQAYELLISTNNFPEFTGRICPAPCEASCVLGINNDPVTIEHIEKSITEMAFENNWVEAKIPSQETGKTVAVIGSGPSGLACADELRSWGHSVVVYERQNKPGGLLRYGIPDFKLDKAVLERRIDLMKASGIEFKTNQNIGTDTDPKELLDRSDAVVLCIGSTVPRDLPIDGRDLKGIHFAMDYLTQVNKMVGGEEAPLIDCKDKNVLVIGGGDTGSDCIGSANRLGAKSVTQLELLSKPPSERSEDNPWPLWPMVLRTTSSHEEGAERKWSVATKRFLSKDGSNLTGVETVKIQWEKDETGKYGMQEIPGSEEVLNCDLVFLAIGFVHPLLGNLFNHLNLSLDQKRNIATDNYQTSVDKLFAAGDARMGQSLVVHAIAEGRKVAHTVDAFLMATEKKKIVRSIDNPLAL